MPNRCSLVPSQKENVNILVEKVASVPLRWEPAGLATQRRSWGFTEKQTEWANEGGPRGCTDRDHRTGVGGARRTPGAAAGGGAVPRSTRARPGRAFSLRVSRQRPLSASVHGGAGRGGVRDGRQYRPDASRPSASPAVTQTLRGSAGASGVSKPTHRRMDVEAEGPRRPGNRASEIVGVGGHETCWDSGPARPGGVRLIQQAPPQSFLSSLLGCHPHTVPSEWSHWAGDFCLQTCHCRPNNPIVHCCHLMAK